MQKIIQQLERLGLTRLSDKKSHERYNLTSKQKRIFSALEIDEKEYHKFVEEAKK
jgi:predicted transcriptional regulator